MDKRICLLFLVFALAAVVRTHEDVPYQSVEKICETCVCLTGQDADKRYHYMLSCAKKSFKHILPRWPTEFGQNHNNIAIAATFSDNSIELLQQLPATNASLSFACRNCGIKRFQTPAFMDVPNLRRLDLSWNAITVTELTPDVFRGPYRLTSYEPIALMELDLSHNQLNSLDRKLFEHTPNLTKLNLSYNKFGVLDNPTSMALASLRNLMKLDLSYVGIRQISPDLFNGLINLKMLNLAGNAFTTMPAGLNLLGKSLETLNLAGNPIAALTEPSFLGLKTLRRLNISDMPTLKYIAKNTFARLETLEYLYCANNPKLADFDLDSLTHATNLTQLDISNCGISTVTLATALALPPGAASRNGSMNASLPLPWPRLHHFAIVGNPWLCDCELLQTLDYMGAHYNLQDGVPRCDTPYFFAGAPLSNLTADYICALQIPKKYRVVDEDPPRFLRKRYIILTVITASVVLVIGLMIGFVVACIRRRLKRDDYGVEPIRYTSVRCSNLSAFGVPPPTNATNQA